MEEEYRASPADGEREVAPVAPEYLLRQRAITLIEQADPSTFDSLVGLYSGFGVSPTAEQIQEELVHGLRDAHKSNMWGGGASAEGTISLGYYHDEASYFTLLFHEAGHYTLNQLGRDTATYFSNPEPEEAFCWRFSQGITSLLDLPYSREEADLSFGFFKVLSEIARSSDDAVLARLNDLVEREKAYRGWSEFDPSKSFKWNEHGVPVIVENSY